MSKSAFQTRTAQGWTIVKDGSYKMRHKDCPICGGVVFILKHPTINQAKEVCCTCRWYSQPLPCLKNLKKRTNTTLSHWATTVGKEYSWHCAICDSTDRVEAHHIFPVSAFPEYKYDINNGILLCRDCHMKLHKFMKGGMNDD